MRKVLAYIQSPTYGGLHNILFLIAPQLEISGWEFVVLVPNTSDNNVKKLTQKNIKLRYFAINRLRATLNLKYHLKFVWNFKNTIDSIRKIIREENIQIVQLMGLLCIHGAIAAKLEKKPIIWQLHSNFTPQPFRYIFSIIVNYFASITMSNSKKIRDMHVGIKRRIPNIVFYPPVNKEILKHAEYSCTSVKNNELTVGTIGNKCRQKGHDNFVRIIKEVSKTMHIKGKIVGNISVDNISYYQKHVVEKAKKYDLIKDNVIEFITPNKEIINYYKMFDVFLLTSIAEASPTVLFEAMCIGVPIVSYDVGGVGEILKDDCNGYLCKRNNVKQVAEKILFLLNNPQKRMEFAEKGKAFIKENYHKIDCAQAHIEAYDLVLKNESKKR